MTVYSERKNCQVIPLSEAVEGSQGGGAVAPPMFFRASFLILLIPICKNCQGGGLG